jgi:hypothetical protein
MANFVVLYSETIGCQFEIGRVVATDGVLGEGPVIE